MFEFLKKKVLPTPVFQSIEDTNSSMEDTHNHDQEEEALVLRKKVNILESENEYLKEALLGIQADLAGSVKMSEEAVGNFKINETRFYEIIQKSGDIETNTKSLNDMITKTDELVLLVNEKTDFVLEIVKKIEEIALQSKLLSFNASVEAARAGEAGKGFSVVALEVQRMSNQTSDSLKLIKDGAAQILGSSKSLTSSMRVTREKTGTIIENLNEFISQLELAIGSNTNSLKNVYSVNDRIFMSLAKIDHLVWKINTYLTMIKKEKVFDFVDHHNCRLGKWYEQGAGRENFSKCSSYDHIESPHGQVHQATKKVFEYVDGIQDIDQVEIAISNMEEASSRLFKNLDQLLIEKS